jgi:hypothetical protein
MKSSTGANMYNLCTVLYTIHSLENSYIQCRESIHYAHYHMKTVSVIIHFKVTLWIVSLTIYHINKKEVERQANVVCNNRVSHLGSFERGLCFRESLQDSRARGVSVTPWVSPEGQDTPPGEPINIRVSLCVPSVICLVQASVTQASFPIETLCVKAGMNTFF